MWKHLDQSEFPADDRGVCSFGIARPKLANTFSVVHSTIRYKLMDVADDDCKLREYLVGGGS
jgi:hypothetical protein